MVACTASTADASSSSSRLQVSFPSMPPRSCPTSSSQTPKIPKVVRMQRLLLQEEILDDNEDLETWILAHLIHEYINPMTKEKMLRLRYGNEEEEDVCQGGVHRPYLPSQSTGKSDHPSHSITLHEHVTRAVSSEPPYASHESSAKEDSTPTASNGEAEVPTDSEETVNDAERSGRRCVLLCPSSNISGPCAVQSAPPDTASSRSLERTLGESKYEHRKTAQPATDADHMHQHKGRRQSALETRKENYHNVGET